MPRPKLCKDNDIIAARAEGLSYIQIADKLGVAKSTVGNVLRRVGGTNPASPVRVAKPAKRGRGIQVNKYPGKATPPKDVSRAKLYARLRVVRDRVYSKWVEAQ